MQSYNFNFVVTDDGVVMVDTVFDNSSDEEFVPAVDERVGKFLFFFSSISVVMGEKLKLGVNSLNALLVCKLFQ